MSDKAEQGFQEQIIQLARIAGFEHIYHTWRSDHSPAGFPDLLLLKGGCLIVAELKSNKGQLTPEQYFWLCEFQKIPSCESYLWCPEDWDEIKKVLGVSEWGIK